MFDVDSVSFIETSYPRGKYFSVLTPDGLTNSPLWYGSHYGVDIGLYPGHVVVPAGCPVMLQLDTRWARIRSLMITHRSLINDDGSPFNLTKGS